jgi:serine/threonine-protein kinase
MDAGSSGAVDVPAPGAVIGGRYRVRHVLGRGGVGVVLAAEPLAGGAACAVKLMLPAKAADPVLRRRFLREARAARSLASPNIARVLDVGADEHGRPYYVMELLEGASLERLLAERGRLGVTEAVDCVLQACEGLAEAHARGIVHRDLKPSNLHLTRGADGAPVVKVLDFGISKIDPSQIGTEGALTDERVLLGSPAFMSPEQLRDPRHVDARTDIWSLGVVLHQLVTGRLPFEGRGLADHFAMVLTDPPVPLRAHRPDAPAELEAVVHRCLQKEPLRRYQDLAGLARALVPLGPAGADGCARRVEERLRVAGALAAASPRSLRKGGPVLVGAATLAEDGPAALGGFDGAATLVLGDEDAAPTTRRSRGPKPRR